MGGCGKTELSSKFAYDNQESYWAVFTIRTEKLETAKKPFAEIGKIGGLEATESAGKYWLSQLSEPWLPIIDNADNPDLDLKSFFPRGDRALYLSMVSSLLVQTLGYEHERTMVAMLGLAEVRWGLGRLEEAIWLQKRVVEARSKVLGPDHQHTLTAMDQLGRSFWLHGQYQEALQSQRVTTDRMKATLGSDHPDTFAALDNLGVTLGSWHRFKRV